VGTLGQSDDERVTLTIDVLRKLGDGEHCLDEFGEPIGIDVLAMSVRKALESDRISAAQREVLFLRSRLLNSLLFGHEGAATIAISPLTTLDSTEDLDLEEALNLPKPWGLLKVLSLLTTFPVLTKLGATRREALLGQAERLRDLELPHTWSSAVLLSWAWMFCSYATSPDRHAIKPVLNAIARRWLHRARVRANPLGRRLVARPRLVVIAEALKSSHVQYRYFARYLRQLRLRFEVVIAAPPEHLDLPARALADEVVELRIGRHANLALAARMIEEARPDIVFWPSVGMATWGPFLANLRFAHVQLTGLGHSASTFSLAMDYYLTEAAYASSPRLFSEKLLLLPDDSLRFEASPFEARPVPQIRNKPSPLHVAIPGNALKLNPNFISVLATINRRVSRPLQFMFFPNTRGTQADALKRALRASIPSTTIVLPRLEPNEYLKELAKCDVALSPFPFGGLHSTIDALSLGLPVIAMEGEQPHARTDALVMRRLDLPHWLLAQTEPDYVSAASRVISDDSVRVRIGAAILDAEPLEAFFGPYPRGLETAVSDAVWAAYRHHDAIQASEKRSWHLSELMALK